MSKSDKDLLNELLSPMEREVIMHALCAGRAGRTGRKPKAYRNHFAASKGHADWPALQALVARGLMEDRCKVSFSPYTYFTVTEAGAKAAGMELPEEATTRKQHDKAALRHEPVDLKVTAIIVHIR